MYVWVVKVSPDVKLNRLRRLVVYSVEIVHTITT